MYVCPKESPKEIGKWNFPKFRLTYKSFIHFGVLQIIRALHTATLTPIARLENFSQIRLDCF